MAHHRGKGCPITYGDIVYKKWFGSDFRIWRQTGCCVTTPIEDPLTGRLTFAIGHHFGSHLLNPQDIRIEVLTSAGMDSQPLSKAIEQINNLLESNLDHKKIDNAQTCCTCAHITYICVVPALINWCAVKVILKEFEESRQNLIQLLREFTAKENPQLSRYGYTIGIPDCFPNYVEVSIEPAFSQMWVNGVKKMLAANPFQWGYGLDPELLKTIQLERGNAENEMVNSGMPQMGGFNNNQLNNGFDNGFNYGFNNGMGMMK